jgi:hypothetical protein
MGTPFRNQPYHKSVDNLHVKDQATFDLEVINPCRIGNVLLVVEGNIPIVEGNKPIKKDIKKELMLHESLHIKMEN